MRIGKKAARDEGGEELKVAHLDSERFGTATPGFFVVKSAEEWKELWNNTGTHPEPPKVDFERQMLLVGATDSAQAQALRVQQVLVTGTSVHAYVREVRPGEGCPVTNGGVAKQDFAFVDRIEKPVHFHIEPEVSHDCGGGPEVVAQCRVQSSGVPSGLAPSVESSMGQTIECEGKLAVRGTFAAIDERWYFGELPPGSASKLTFGEGGKKVSFPLDAFGKYLVRFEVIDDAGRKGTGQAAINVSPPKDGLYVRLVWTEFGPTDDPETFPRTALELKQGAVRCAADSTAKPAWCDLKTQGHATQVKMPVGLDGTFPMTVQYTDDRFAGGPVACIKVILAGKETASVCDKQPRKAGDVWDPGSLTGKTGVVDVAPAPAAPLATATGTAAAPIKPPPARPLPPVGPKPPAVPKVPPKPKGPVFTP